MFDDRFLPARAVVAADGQLQVSADRPGELQVGLQPFEPGLSMYHLSGGDAVAAAFALPGPGCFVVSASWSAEAQGGTFVALAGSEPLICPGG